MRFPIDHFYKRLFGVLFAGRGRLESEVEVAVDTQRVETRFRPTPGAGPPDVGLGTFALIAASSAVIESYSRPPSFDEVRDCVRKLLALHHLEVRRTRRVRGRAPPEQTRLRPFARRPPTPEIPVLWIISAGRPRGALDAFALRRRSGWPTGIYSGPQRAIPVRLVVVNELPGGRDTLVLRLMGRGAVRRRAMIELAALPEDSWERRQIAPLLVDLQRKLAQEQATRPLLEEEEEIIVNGQKLIEQIENRGRKAGRLEGREEGLIEGREQGLAALVRVFTRKLGRPLTDREQKTLSRRLDTLGPDRLGDVALDLDGPALATWLANTRAR